MSLQDEVSPTINPGDNFYEYVNKKWCDANPIPADKSEHSEMSALDDHVTEHLYGLLRDTTAKETDSANSYLARALYASGMDVDGIEARGLDPITPFIDEVDRVKEATDIHAIITKCHGSGRALLWRLGIDVDEKNSERYVITVGQGGLLLPNRDYYFEEGERFDAIRLAYKQFLAQVFTLLGKDDVDDRVEHVYTIEEALASASNTSTENRDVDALYNPMTFSEMAQQFDGFDWKQYQSETGLTNLSELIVHQPKFIAKAVQLLQSQNIASLQDYCIAHSVIPFMPHLAKKYADIHFAFYGTTLSGVEQQEERYKRVIHGVLSMLPDPVGQLYIGAYFDAASKAAIIDLVEHIQEALRVRILHLDWMSDETKKKALEKLDTFMPLLGYPDEWRSYESLELTNDYVQNILAIRKLDWLYDTSRVLKPVNRREWLMSPATVNAYYWSNTNGITFPAAILQPPAFDAKADFAANYGAIGMVIGHEITHGFDDKGSKYDKVGNLNSWWTDADRAAFDSRAQALAEQYGSYEINGKHVNGELTLGENIADLGGMLIAFDALQQKLEESGQTEKIDGFTPEQRFFMAEARIWRTNMRPELSLQLLVGDTHSPAHLRVNAVVTNIDAWYEAWGVSTTSKMYKAPEARIRIW